MSCNQSGHEVSAEFHEPLHTAIVMNNMPRVRKDVTETFLKCYWPAFFSAILLVCGLLRAELPTPKLETVFPPGGRIGTEFEVHIGGSDLDDAAQLIFSHPGITGSARTETANEFLTVPRAVPGKFLVKIDEQVPPGNYELRVTGRFGASNSRIFAVNSLEEITLSEPHATPESAKELAPNIVVNAKSTASQISYFKIPAQQGQRIFVNCWGERIDSRIDATLVLLSPDGHEIKRVRNSVGRDPVLDFVAPSDGDYVVGVYDYVYQGGDHFFYRLSTQLAPYIDFVFPPVGIPGTTSSFTLFGRNLPNGQPVEEFTVDGLAVQQETVEIALSDDAESLRSLEVASVVQSHSVTTDGMVYRLITPGGVSNPVTIGFAAHPVIVEEEPNNVPAESQEIVVPCEYAGRFFPARDDDWVKFPAKKGEKYWIEVISHRLGVLADPHLLVQKVTPGEDNNQTVTQVGTADDMSALGEETPTFDTRSYDSIYQLTADEDAVYQVRVRDLFNSTRQDTKGIYRLIIRTPQPDFRLVAYAVNAEGDARHPTSAVLRRGGTTVLDIRIQRQDGFSGDILVSAEDLPEGVACNGAILRRDDKIASLILHATEEAPGWTGAIRVLGTAEVDGQQVIRQARGGDLVWTTPNVKNEPPVTRLAQEVNLSVVDKETAPLLVRMGDSATVETSLGGKLELPVKLTRRGEFKAEVTLTAVGLPGKMKPDELKITGDEAQLALAVTDTKIQPGTYTFYLQGASKYSHARNPDAIANATQEQQQMNQIVEQLSSDSEKSNAQKEMAAKTEEGALQKVEVARQTVESAEQNLQKASQVVEQVNTAVQTLTEAKQGELEDPAAEAVNKLLEAAGTLVPVAESGAKTADEDLTAAKQSLADAETAAEAAVGSKTEAEKAATELNAKLERARQVKEATDKRLTAIQEANKPQERNFAIVSIPINVQIAAVPVTLAVPSPESELPAGNTLPVSVSLERKYGFSDTVELSLELPDGLSAEPVQLAADKNEATFQVNAGAEAPVGEQTITVRAKLSFNEVPLETTESFQLIIAKGE